MAITKDYGLSGIANQVQFGKAGGNIFYNKNENKFVVTKVNTNDLSPVSVESVEVNTGNIFYDNASKSFSVQTSTDNEYAELKVDSLQVINGDVVIVDPQGKIDFIGTNIELNQTGVLEITGGRALVVPNGTTAGRPDTPGVGMIRINTDVENNAVIEFYNGTGWQKIGPLTAATGTPLSFANVDGKIEITLGTVLVVNGGTGKTSLTEDQILFGKGTEAVGQTSGLTYNETSQSMVVGQDAPIKINGKDSIIEALGTDSNILLLPNGEGSVVVGGVGDSVLQSGPGEDLTVRANTAQLFLESQLGSTTFRLADDNLAKITISGPSSSTYSQGLSDNDLVNKYYVDNLVNLINGGNF